MSGQQETYNAPAAILPLAADAIAQIKSSTTVTDFNGVVFGLLQNSLDARATTIAISIDFRRGGCSTEDNGLGIPPSEFREQGGLGRMYHTSKQQENERLDLHGGQGTFLASVAALSSLTITSRHHQHHSHNTLAIHRAKPISRLTPAPPQHEIRNSSYGTRVTVRDLFGNMPVRVKQRALAAEEVTEVEKQWQALKKGIVALLLPWNSRVIVKVVNTEHPAKSYSINTSGSFAPNTLSERNLNALNQKTSSLDQGTALSILTQAGFILADSKDSWIPASASTSSVRVRGLVSMEPAPNKTAQFISIGITPCMDENRHNELYDTVNRVFHQSNFGHVDDTSEPDEAEKERRRYDRRYKKDGPTNKQIRGGRKGVDRWPRFYLRVDLQDAVNQQPVSRLSDVHLKSIVNVLDTLTTHWLEAHNFRPEKPRRKKAVAGEVGEVFDSSPRALSTPMHQRDDSKPSLPLHTSSFGVRPASQAQMEETSRPSPKKAKPNPHMNALTVKIPFTDWSRIKSARPQMYDDIWKCKTPLSKQSAGSMTADTSRERSASMDGTSSKINVESVLAGQFNTDGSEGLNSGVDPLGARPLPQDVSTDRTIVWTNPTTKEKHRINARTGIVMPDIAQRPASEGFSDRPTAAAKQYTSSLGRPLLLGPRNSTLATASTVSSPWFEKFLQTWNNPVFANPTEQAIPVAGFVGPGQGSREPESLARHCVVAGSFVQAGRVDMSRLSKTALAHAQVVSQVDRKFILMKMSSTMGMDLDQLDYKRQLLVLMDQHAASERCILETLLEELCMPSQHPPSVRSNLGYTSPINVVQLDKPLHFQVPPQEEALFRTQATNFASWGILYDVNVKTSGSTLAILTLPSAISERCQASPSLLIDLMRSEIHDPTSLRSRSMPQMPSDEERPWLKRLGSCPRGLLEMINSRACRSAVMFNDKLELSECKELVKKVADCVFPFMCAHGRNSMVPLVYLEQEQEAGRTDMLGGMVEQKEESFAAAYKKWRTKKR